ncbi:MAG TPA: hypothetical protein VNT99_10670 [Methylomirabilota bacterium]|nr:hypothetical protein [Methylomirabilota bacterium]
MSERTIRKSLRRLKCVTLKCQQHADNFNVATVKVADAFTHFKRACDRAEIR